MRIPTAERHGLAIPVVPLANIVLLLTLFFPLAGFGDGGLAGMTLPGSRHGARALPDSAWIVVTSGERGVRYLLLDGAAASREVTGIDALATEAASILERDPARTLVIRADAGLEYGRIDEILDRLRRAGAGSILLETTESP